MTRMSFKHLLCRKKWSRIHFCQMRFLFRTSKRVRLAKLDTSTMLTACFQLYVNHWPHLLHYGLLVSVETVYNQLLFIDSVLSWVATYLSKYCQKPVELFNAYIYWFTLISSVCKRQIFSVSKFLHLKKTLLSWEIEDRSVGRTPWQRKK